MKLPFATSLVLPALFLALSSAPSSVWAKKKVLIYSYTQGFRHDSIPAAVKTIKSLGKNNSPGWSSVHSEDPADFNDPDFLDQFDALVFVSVSGKALSKKGAANMRNYIENGGGYMGVHQSCDALNDYSWYGRLVGAYFDYHPEHCHATLKVEDPTHPSVSHLGKSWKVLDEIYSYTSNPSLYGKQYVLSVDEDSYPDPVTSKADRAAKQGKVHPIAWYKEGGQLNYNPHVKVGGGTDPKKSERRKHVEGNGGDGRSFYTSLGHLIETWSDDDFQGHIHGALQWVLESPTLRSSSADAAANRPGSKYDGPAETTKTASSVKSSNGNGAVSASLSSDDAESTDIIVNGQRVPVSSANFHAASSPSSSSSLSSAGSLAATAITALLACGAVAVAL